LSYVHEMLRIIWILPGGCALLAVLVLALAFKTVDRSDAQLMPNAARTRVALIELGEHPEWRQFLTFSAVHRANELNRLRELLDIQVANDVASGPPKVAPQPANRSDSDPEDSNVLNMQSRAADIGASTPVQGPIANENQAVGVQEEKAAIGTLLEDTPVAVQEEKPTVSALEETPVTIQEETPTVSAFQENPLAIQEENSTVKALKENPVAVQEEKPTVSALEEKPVKPTKATPDKKSAAIRTPRRVKPRTQSPSKGIQHLRSARAPSKQNPPSPQYFFEPFGHQQASQTSTVNTSNNFTNQQARQVSTPNTNNYFGNQRTGQPEMPNASNY
ncbi:MAG: hypothetical protein WAO14_06655, partial [Pseudolabrys sp.]